MYNYDIAQVIPTDNYKVYLYFQDGKIKLFDAKELVTKGVFKQLQDVNVFKSTCTVMNDTLAWDLEGNRDEFKCLDLDSYNLYQQCIEVDEPSHLFNSH